jgi:mannose-1-phosphate guanylyltransferase
MQDVTHRSWAILLAAGAGTRLSQLTADPSGQWVPKQYCSLGGRATLLEDALARARCVAPPERTLVVVAAEHERWWNARTLGVPQRNLVVQPANRGTAAGLYLPLLEVLARDPGAVVSVLPADHGVAREAVFARALRAALAHATAARGELVLLGITPDEADSEYGWIVPDVGRTEAVRAVRSFVEEPEAERARALFEGGALWSSFVFAVEARALAERMVRTVPDLTAALEGALRLTPAELVRRYRDVPLRDVSRDVLQVDARGLRLLTVPPCGWTDLGTPRRVAQCLELRARARAPRVNAQASSLLDLGVALARWNPLVAAG